MKSIFTYPNNGTTHFIDPDYIGDQTEGFEKRIQDLYDGNYKTWPGVSPQYGIGYIIKTIGRFNNALEDYTGQNTINAFYRKPHIEAIFRAKAQIVKDISIVNDSGTAKLKVEFTAAHGYTSGDRIYGYGWEYIDGFNKENNHDIYAQVINTTEIYVSDDSAGTDFNLGGTIETTSKFSTIPETSNPRVIRRDSGALLKLDSQPTSWDNNTVIQLLTDFDESHDTGTANQTDTPFYITQETGTDHTWFLYTNSGKTTGATIAENYIAESERVYTSAGTVQLQNIQYFDYAITSDEENELESQSNGWCRIHAIVTDGSFTGKSSSPETIPAGAISYAGEFYWEANTDGTTFTIYDKRGTNKTVQDFVLADVGTGVNVTIHIDFINPANTTGYAKYLLDDTDEAGSSFADTTSPSAGWEVKNIYAGLKGTSQYQYQDTNNVTQNGAVFVDGYWNPGSATKSALTSGESMPADSFINLNGSGYLNNFTLTPAGISDDRGTFDTYTTMRALFEIQSADDTYVAPTVSLAAQEDVWDTDDEWDNQAYNAQKRFPSTVAPMTVTIRQVSPTATSNSQSGIKFARKAGYAKYALDVEYPPMTAEQFEEYRAFIAAVNGQFHPFQYPLKQNNTDVLTGLTRNPSQGIRLLDDLTAGDKYALVEGFASDNVGSITKGEIIIFTSNKHGDIVTATSSTDANKYGEAKFRLDHPAYVDIGAGTEIFKNPGHIVVTLDSDTVEVTRDTAGYYYLAFSITADGWK